MKFDHLEKVESDLKRLQDEIWDYSELANRFCGEYWRR